MKKFTIDAVLVLTLFTRPVKLTTRILHRLLLHPVCILLLRCRSNLRQPRCRLARGLGLVSLVNITVLEQLPVIRSLMKLLTRACL